MKLLILGGGAVVREYYSSALRALKWQERALIIEPSADGLGLLQRVCPGILASQTDFVSALQSPALVKNFDAAVVALPNSLHDAAVEACLTAGLHVLCEKPLALSSVACLRLAERARRANRLLCVGMVRRLLPNVIALREALSNGAIGDVTSIEISDGAPYSWASDSGAAFRRENGGILTDMGVHFLDLAHFLFGALTPVSYVDDNFGGVESNVEYRLQTGTGIPVAISLSRTRTLRNTSIVRGTRGELWLERAAFDSCGWRTLAGKLEGRLVPVQPFQRSEWTPGLEACFAQQLLNFASAIEGKNVAMVDGAMAAATMSLIEWAHANRKARASFYLGAACSPSLSSAGNVVITGATGFIGSALVERLHQSDHGEIRALLRTFRTASDIARFPVNMQRVGLLDPGQLDAQLRDARYVFHLAYGRDGDDARRVTVDGTRNIVEAAIRAGVESITILSTAFVFGFPAKGGTIDESAPYAPMGGEYGKSKAEMERWCLNRARSSDHTRIVILNPTCVYGPNGKTYTRLPLELAGRGAFCWVDGGQGTANYTYVENLVDAMLLAAQTPRAHGQRFLINDGSTTWREFLTPLLGSFASSLPSYDRQTLHALNRPARMYKLPAIILRNAEVRNQLFAVPQLKLLVGFAKRYFPRYVQPFRLQSDMTWSNHRNRSEVPPEWLADLFGVGAPHYSTRKAEELLGWQPRVDPAGALKRTLEWLIPA